MDELIQMIEEWSKERGINKADAKSLRGNRRGFRCCCQRR